MLFDEAERRGDSLFIPKMLKFLLGCLLTNKYTAGLQTRTRIMSCREMNYRKLCLNNNVLICILFYIPVNTSLRVCKFLFRRYYQLLKQTFTRKSPRDAPANTISDKSCKYHLHGQQHSAQHAAKTRTESHADSKDDMEIKTRKTQEFRTKSALTGTEANFSGIGGGGV